VIIRTSFPGSQQGISAVVGSLGDTFIPTSATMTGGGQANTSSTQALTASSSTIAFAISDVRQGTTTVQGTVLVGAGPATVVAPDLSSRSTPLGVIPFRFFASNNAPFTNITEQQVRALYSVGELPLSAFTGNPADAATLVLPFGRAADSGTRLTMLAETRAGVFTPVEQYGGTSPTITSGAITATGARGNGGASGSNIAAWLKLPATAVNVNASGGSTNCIFVGYMGGSDVTTALTNPNNAEELAYNGVLYGGDNSKVTSGQYSFWCVPQLIDNPNLVIDENSVEDDFKDEFLLHIDENVQTDAIALTAMQVDRTADGGIVKDKN